MGNLSLLSWHMGGLEEAVDRRVSLGAVTRDLPVPEFSSSRVSFAHAQAFFPYLSHISSIQDL